MSERSSQTIAQQVMEIDRLTMQVEQRDREAVQLRLAHALAGSDYADLKRDFEALAIERDEINDKNSELWIEVAELAQRVEELEAELGRSEDRRYEDWRYEL